MNNKPFEIERTYNAPVEKVWQAITDKAQMKQWYFDMDAFQPEVGFEFSFSGQGSKGEPYVHLCQVKEVIPNRKLSYSWTYSNYEGYSVVTFELFDEGDKTRLKLTHEGLDSFPRHPDFAVESFTAGWTELIGKNLKEFVEKA